MRTIIAEFCQNHKGDLTLLKEMVWAAAEAGATYAKVQSMLADDLSRRERFEAGAWEGDRQTAIKRPYQPEYDRLKPMDLSDEAHYLFAEECRKAGIKPLTTVFSRSRIPFLASLGWDAIKVASYDCASLPMLRELKERFPHLFISTGATYNEEIEAAARLLQGHSFSLLHAVTIYPTPLDELHLARMAYLRRFTSSVGFSDHTLVARDGIKAAIVAMSMGAEVIERHFTILDPAATRDGPVSIRPQELKALVDFSRMETGAICEYIEREIPEAGQMVGLEHRPLSHVELLNRDYYRGRFASRVIGEIVYNWEDRQVFGGGAR
jgi:N,N'-diacetyllegionaminate synthase